MGTPGRCAKDIGNGWRGCALALRGRTAVREGEVRAHFVENQIHVDARGVLMVAGAPFEPKRVFWIDNVPHCEWRAGHALRTCHQVLIALRGRFDVIVDGTRWYHLCSPQFGLHIEPMAWRVMRNFSSDALCLVLASEEYDGADYIKDYDEYLKQRG